MVTIEELRKQDPSHPVVKKHDEEAKERAKMRANMEDRVRRLCKKLEEEQESNALPEPVV